MKTSGYGGRNIRELVQVHTNDDAMPIFELMVSGFVEKFANITPERAVLSGPADSRLSTSVRIVPRKEYPFRIKHVRFLDGRFIRTNLEKQDGSGHSFYILTVTNIRQEPGRYSDLIYLDTDSPMQSVVPVYVVGNILQPGPPATQ